MRIIQRYSRAATSSNLRDDEHNHQTEILAAAALASMHIGCELGTKLFRVKYSNDASSYPNLLSEWCDIVKSKSRTRNWPEEISHSKIAKESLNYWLNDQCIMCGGHGHQEVENVPQVLKDDPCAACDGSGRRALGVDVAHNRIEYVEQMVELLEKMIIHAGGETMRKLSDEMSI